MMKHLGISGCKLELIDDGVLRKTSTSIEYNARLQKQMEKQRDFAGWCRAAKVYGSGYVDEMFYFDMEYVHGKSFNEAFQDMSAHDLSWHVSDLVKYLDYNWLSKPCYEEDELRRAMIIKLVQLKPYTRYDALVHYVIDVIRSSSMKYIPKGPCHGDLTYSNILFANSDTDHRQYNICLIDFLDSHIDSVLMDLIKLKQDLYYKWHLNFVPDVPRYTTRVDQSMAYVWDRLYNKYHMFFNCPAGEALDIINYLRIEPYLTTPEQFAALDATIRKTKLYEKFNRSHDGKIYPIS